MLILAYLSMLVDHIGAVFFPDVFMFRIIGRVSLPIFAIKLTQGYKHTKNFYYYLFRILLLAIISQPLYTSTFGYESFELLNICFLLFMGLIYIKVFEKLHEMKLNNALFYFIITFLIIASLFIPMSYGTYGLLMILIVYYFRNDFTKFFISFSAVSFVFVPFMGNIIQFIPLFIFPILFSLEDNKFLNIDMKIIGFKYAHYLFYPLHLLLLLIIKNYV